MVRLLHFALLLGYLQADTELSPSTTPSIPKGTTQNEANVEFPTEDPVGIDEETTDLDPTEFEQPSVKVKPQYEVNMRRCFRDPSICFVGVNCLINGNSKGRHGRIVCYAIEYVIVLYYLGESE